jgi:spermidine synthase
MKKQKLNTPAPPDSQRWLPALLVLFVGSGGAALIYEIIWFQLLQLVIGSSAISLGVLLGTFMGGMCLGSLLLPRVVDARRHPLRVYAYLEFGIGACGLLVLFGVPLIGGAYTAGAGLGLTGPFVRAVVAGVCLLPPTLLMGATLPAVARWVEATPRGVSWLGFFYGGNIAGAVIGSLLAGFYLLRVYDLQTATLVAVSLNVIVALLALFLAKTTRHEPGEAAKEEAERPRETHVVYVAIALSGLTALAAEVIWTRNLSLLFGGTVYAFSLILAVFLLGLGLGSSFGSALAHRTAQPRVALGWCQMLLCAAMAWAAYMIGASLPYWPINPSLSPNPWFNFQLDLVRCLWTVLPGAILWGMSFPLALAAAATRGQDTGRLVSGVYAANTVGAIVGSLSASLLLVAWLGSQHAQQVLIALSGLSALLMLAPTATRTEAGRERWHAKGALLLVAATAGSALLLSAIPQVPGILVAEGRYAATALNREEILYVGEGVMASVAVSRASDGYLQYHNAGKVQASGKLEDMRLQRTLGHLTTLMPAQPRSVLVIGCGAGVTAGAVSVDPQVERVTIAEIEPLVPRVVSTYFSQHNYDVVRNPKVQVKLDDGRHYLMTTKEKFDAITSDPLDPWVKGAAMLYTKEFYEGVKRHLNPGGVVSVWVPLYQTNEASVQSQLATFFDVFPNGVVFGNTEGGEGYDLVLLGQAEPAPINLDALDERLSRPEYSVVAHSLSEIGIRSAVDLFASYAGQGPDLAEWLQGAAINRDRNLRLQYLAGWALNSDQALRIYRHMLAYNRYPERLFIGSELRLQALRKAIAPNAP